MLRTPVCAVLGIDVPVVQGALGGPWDQLMELPAAVCEAGGLGSVPTALRTAGEVRADIARLRRLTSRPFAVNMTRRPFSDDVFEAVLADAPQVFSLALGEPGDLVSRVHDAGCVFMHQVSTVEQAVKAADAGVDVIVAQGGEAGGFSGEIGTIALIPQVVDAVAPVPVLAAGGIADGRGLAAALALGAQGVSLGTRFLASSECGVHPEWKDQIVAATSEDAVKIAFSEYVFAPPTAGGYQSVPRSLRTGFVDEWNARPADAAAEADLLRAQIRMASANGIAHQLVPMTGQSAGMIAEIRPAGDIVRALIAGAEDALRAAPGPVR
jgi:nitronate monooxygenase/enoyl-[acyl-carrier protein] reductase II